jgi:uncharacterized protein (TIGR00255 family)
MISSMTGYAARTNEITRGAAKGGSSPASLASLAVELKSVNSRFLDLTLRLPEELRSLEPALRERISTKVQRGKVECRMSLAPAPGTAPGLALNKPLLSALAEASRAVQAAIPDARALNVGEVLHWPGMLAEDPDAAEELRAGALAVFDATLHDYIASRGREGEKLARMIEERVSAMQAIIQRVKPMLPEALAAYQEKMSTRLREVLSGSDEDRIRQELAMFGIKFDVAEELSRLEVHASEVRRVLSAGGAAGKRLDFLMQELNREANTLGSKSVAREVSDAVVELKLLIEQMREQVQNIE